MSRLNLLLAVLVTLAFTAINIFLVGATAASYQSCEVQDPPPQNQQRDPDSDQDEDQQQQERKDQERQDHKRQDGSDESPEPSNNELDQDDRFSPAPGFTNTLANVVREVKHRAESDSCEKETPWRAMLSAGAITFLTGAVVMLVMGGLQRRENSAHVTPPVTPTPSAAAVASSTGTHRVVSGTGTYPIVDPARSTDTPAQASGTQTTQTAQQRSALIDTLIYVRDRATSPAISEKVLTDLQNVGVRELSPVGEAFDAQHHEAGGHTAPTEASQNGTIAAVEVPGYADGSQVLRAPIVTVYRSENQ